MVNRFLSGRGSVRVLALLSPLVLLTAALVCIGLACAMRPIPYPTPAFPIKDLLLDESVFPEGWKAHEPFDPEHWLPAEQILLHFHTDRCPPCMVGGGHCIFRFFGGAKSATEAYPEEIAFWFSPNWGDWSVPAELPYESAVADQFHFACYTEEKVHYTHCQALGQYQEYIVAFDAALDPEHPECLTFTDLERVLVAIDERMASYLERDTQ